MTYPPKPLDPPIEYDKYDANEQERLLWTMMHYTCGDCKNCQLPSQGGIDYYDEIGYCDVFCQFVWTEVTAEEMDCCDVDPTPEAQRRVEASC